MSQYPYPPYQPPAPGYYNPSLELYAPARRASVLMFVIAGFLLLCGLCVSAVVRWAPLDELAASSGVNTQQISELGITPAQFVRIVYMIMAFGSILLAIVFGTLAIFVRKGGIGSALTSAILTGLLVIVTLFQVVATLIQFAGRQDATHAVAAVISVGMLAVQILLLVWLIGAIRSASGIRAAQAQYAQQYWQMQQQAYQYGAYAGYGHQYPAQPSAPMPNAPLQPPPPPPADRASGGYDDEPPAT
jgi:hypothetical protein